MRALLGGIIAVAVLWGGYWFWGSAQVREHTLAWMSEQGVSGDISVIGFPNRFDLTITDPALQRNGIGYSAPFFQVFAMTWKPWHLIAAFAPSQKITLPDQTLTLSSPHLLASLLTDPLGGFAMRELRLDGTKVALASSDAWHIDAAHVTAAIDAKDDPQSPRVGGRLTDFTPPLPVAGLNDLIDLASIDINLHLNARLDTALTAQSIVSIDIHDVRLKWGDFSLTANGSLAPDAQGVARGEINVTFQGADHLPQILLVYGIITPDQATNLGKGMTAMGGGGQLTLTLSGGAISIGPFPVARAPIWPH